jgi:hypothetical protein
MLKAQFDGDVHGAWWSGNQLAGAFASNRHARHVLRGHHHVDAPMPAAHFQRSSTSATLSRPAVISAAVYCLSLV